MFKMPTYKSVLCVQWYCRLPMLACEISLAITIDKLLSGSSLEVEICFTEGLQ